jgi:Post-segregation antitoxin CcdA
MQMVNKGNVVLYLDKEVVEKSKELGFNLSKTFENHLKHLVNGYSQISMQNNANSSKYKSYLVGPPGFEPGSIAPEATSLDQTSRRPPLQPVFAVFFCEFLS